MPDKRKKSKSGPEAQEFLPLDFSEQKNRQRDLEDETGRDVSAEEDLLVSVPENASPEEKLSGEEVQKEEKTLFERPKPPITVDEIFGEDEDDEGFPDPDRADSEKDKGEPLNLRQEIMSPPPETPARQEEPPPRPKRVSKPVNKLETDKKPVKIVGSISSENASFGQTLQEARVKASLSISQVEMETKIKKDYLESIERDDFKRLPPLVYVSAYVKTLCSLYKIDEGETESILKNLREDAKNRVSEELLQHLEAEKQVNVEEEIKLRRFVITVFASAVSVFVLSIILLLYFLFFSGCGAENEIAATSPAPAVAAATEPKPAPVGKTAMRRFTEKDLEKFLFPRRINMSELPERPGN